MAAVNIDDRKIDFVLAEQVLGPGKGKPAGTSGRRGKGDDRAKAKRGKSAKSGKAGEGSKGRRAGKGGRKKRKA